MDLIIFNSIFNNMPTEVELTWSKDIEDALERIRILCLIRSKYHKNNYFKMLNRLKYFRIPIIILSGLNSVFNVALTNFLSTIEISLLCCFISLTAGLIGSIELFLQIQKNMEVDLLNAKEFYLNGIDICKTLKLAPNNRGRDGSSYLEEKFNNYSKLVESSVIVDKATHDNIISISLIDNLTNDEKMQIINKNTSIETILLLRQQETQTRNNIFDILSTIHLHKHNKIDQNIKKYDEKEENEDAEQILFTINKKPKKFNKINSSDQLFKEIDKDLSSINLINYIDVSFNVII